MPFVIFPPCGHTFRLLGFRAGEASGPLARSYSFSPSKTFRVRLSLDYKSLFVCILSPSQPFEKTLLLGMVNNFSPSEIMSLGA